MSPEKAGTTTSDDVLFAEDCSCEAFAGEVCDSCAGDAAEAALIAEEVALISEEVALIAEEVALEAWAGGAVAGEVLLCESAGDTTGAGESAGAGDCFAGRACEVVAGAGFADACADPLSSGEIQGEGCAIVACNGCAGGVGAGDGCAGDCFTGEGAGDCFEACPVATLTGEAFAGEGSAAEGFACDELAGEV